MIKIDNLLNNYIEVRNLYQIRGEILMNYYYYLHLMRNSTFVYDIYIYI